LFGILTTISFTTTFSVRREVSRFSRFLKGHEHEDEEAEEERHSIFNLGG
jgi:hypothetical protein